VSTDPPAPATPGFDRKEAGNAEIPSAISKSLCNIARPRWHILAVPAGGSGKRLPRSRLDRRLKLAGEFLHQGVNMSLLGITSAASASAAQPVNFLGHARKKPSLGDSASNAGGIGQIPAGAGQNLLSNALQALEQAIGSQSASAIPGAGTTTPAVGAATTAGASSGATAAAASATGATGTTNVKQELQGFLHSLFQALKQQGLGGGAGAATASTAATSSASAAVAGAGAAAGGPSQYAGSLESSLQTLIQQLGSNGAATPATAKLTASFNNLVQGLGGSGATAATAGASANSATATATASTAELKNFLSNFMQNLQHNGVQTPGLVGSNVNASA